VLLCLGEDRAAVKRFFTKKMGVRRCRTLRAVCMDMWAYYANLVREHAASAQNLMFEGFRIVKRLNETVEEFWRSDMSCLSAKERVAFKRSRWLLLKNSLNLTGEQKGLLSTLVRVECADRVCLRPQRGLSTVLGLQTAQAGQRHLGKVHALS
jgi:transposase